MGVLMVASKGIAGVARGTFIVLMATLPEFHLPVWPLLLVFGIDILMDLARTLVNVVGNCLAAVVMAIWEKEFQPCLPRREQARAVASLNPTAAPEVI
jgi:proton glutamate symport protein